MDYGITAFGAYIPRLRLSRGAIAAAHRWMAPSLAGGAKGARAFCSWDEDSVTMAVESARDCLRGDSASSVSSVTLASTSLPYADLQNSAIVAAALALPESVATADAAGSQRAATSALIKAFAARQDGALLIASDKPRAKPASAQEMFYGAGAGALRLGTRNVIARLIGSASVSEMFVDHFRGSDHKYDYFWEERWIRDEGYSTIAPKAIKAALAAAGLAIGDIDHFVMPSMMKGAALAVAKAIGFKGTPAPTLDEDCGYCGAAHALLMLAGVLETATKGQKILLVGFGQGADALVLEVAADPEAPKGRRGVPGSLKDKLLTEDYLRLLSFYDDIDLEWGMRGEKSGKAALTEVYRKSDEVLSFQAGKCRACGTVQFPQLAYCVNPKCNAPAAQFDACSLVDEPARVLTYTEDWLSYHPAPPLFVGFVQFDNGARLLMETVEATSSTMEIGVPLRMVFRIKERDKIRGFNRYFWKATPINI